MEKNANEEQAHRDFQRARDNRDLGGMLRYGASAEANLRYFSHRDGSSCGSDPLISLDELDQVFNERRRERCEDELSLAKLKALQGLENPASGARSDFDAKIRAFNVNQIERVTLQSAGLEDVEEALAKCLEMLQLYTLL